MITVNEYEKAKSIVDQFETEQLEREEKFKKGDIDLMKVLSIRSKNALFGIFEKDEIYISDIVNWLIEQPNKGWYGKYRHYNDLIKTRNIGDKSYDEIMSYINPFLNK